MTTLIVGPANSGKSGIARELCEAGAWWLNLSPASPQFGPLGSADLCAPGNHQSGFRFIGTMHLQRAPLEALDAIRWAKAQSADAGLVVEMPIASLSAVPVHLYRHVVTSLGPGRVVSTGIEGLDWLMCAQHGCEFEVRAPEGASDTRSPSSTNAQRRAAIRSYLGDGHQHEVSIRTARVVGARIGSGLALETGELEELRAMGLNEAVYGEVDSRTLYVVTRGEPDPSAVTACTDRFGCRDAHLVHPRAFAGLIVGLENSHGEHFAIARVVASKLEECVLVVESSSKDLAPVFALHLGLWKTDDLGNEIGEVRRWQV